MTFFPHVVAGMHLGRMEPTPLKGEFDAVLSVGDEPGPAEKGLRLKHVHLAYGPGLPDPEMAADCVHWVMGHIGQDRKVLVRSEGGKNRPALIIGMVVLRMGGSYWDAMFSLREARYDALDNLRFRRLLQAFAETQQERVP